MDSGNNSSGSMQSSSGADEEYDSRTQSSFSAPFVINNHPPPPPQIPFTATTTNPTNFANSHALDQHINNNTAHMLDHLSNYLQDPMQRSPSPNALLNLDMMWSSKPVRPEPNQTDLGAFIPSSPSPSQAHFSSGAFYALQPDPQSAANNNSNSTNPSVQVRNPKKRSRASRRAPTTVLTTDTANFRAMVQEFTGIPAPPFTSSSPFLPRTRFDLFGSSPAAVRSTLLDPSPPPPYLLRPFAQKALHPFHPPSSTSVLDNLLFASNNISTDSVTNSTAINNFQLHPPLTFQNILQTRPSLETPPPISAAAVDSHLKVGLRQAHVTNSNSASTEWAHRSVGAVTNDDCEAGGGGGGGGGTVNYSKVHYSAAAAAAASSSGTECAGRGEGMVESWINCSSSD